MAQLFHDASPRQSPIPAVFPHADASLRADLPRRGAILVVEDREDVRQGLVQLLELHGFLVADAGTGDEALALLRQDPGGFALILLDLLLPGAVDGRGVRLQQLSDPHLAELPTIIMTASEFEPAERHELRPTAWLEKPFRFDHLLQIVRQFVAPEGQPFAPE